MGDGICVAGNLIVDISYPIEDYPRQSELTTITEGITRSTGGLVCNVITDLAKMDSALPLRALGVIGEDAEGDFILRELEKYKNINTDLISREGTTSFTAVMSNNKTKARTFFQYRGANAKFDESYIDWDKIDADILHAGYILLLDTLDEKDEKYGTKMARLLAHAKERGIRTSIDVVSESGDRFKKIVGPALRYTDYCIINELEAQQITRVSLRDDQDALHEENMEKALNSMRKMGVTQWAVIHCPEGGFGIDENGNYHMVNSLKLPDDYIKGTVGAGDAFCAGVLYGAWKKEGLTDAMMLGVCAAAASLSAPGATDGMKPIEELKTLAEKYRSR